ncbi:MAG: hypothetical protein CL472_09290 [Acidobacteria bacterium]|nr:hypothetical protein [Acidobacteriota bacterium]
MTSANEIDPLSDEFWDTEPTALELARLNEAIELSRNQKARQEKAKRDAATKIFGSCLAKLIDLGVPERNARSLLGRWRNTLKDDDRLVALVEHAHSISTPDPVSYMTKAVAGAKNRAKGVKSIQKGEWEELGWEAPTQGPDGPRYLKSVRGKAWRDPFGKLTILPAKDGEKIPTLDQDPGVSE